MRIRRLDLDFFGHFAGKGFDFGPAGGATDFHIIHGPNEAGKTTTKEAFLRLLYGFPNREPYDFQHQRKNLRVSATLEIDGAPHAFTRMPTKAPSLVDASGTAVPENALSAHLGGLSLDDYRNLLCLDDETIERGGEDIANAKGDIGRLLFSAAAGIADLNAVLDQVRNEAAALYRPRASKTRMAELKRELAEIDRRIREDDVSASAWKKLKQALAQASDEEKAARAARDGLRREAESVAAMRQALPWLATIDELETAIAPLAGYPAGIKGRDAELFALSDEQARVSETASRLETALAALDETLASIDIDTPSLHLAGDLAELDTLRSRYTAAAEDLDRRRSILRDILHDMRHAARDLGADEAVDPLGLVRSPAEIVELEQAREAVRQAERDRDGETREVEDLEARLRKALADAADVKAAPPPGQGVAALLARFDAERLAPAEATARQAIRAAEEQARDSLDALALGGRTFATLPPCTMPREDSQSLADRYFELEGAIAAQAERIAEHREAADLRASEIARLTAAGALIGDSEANALLKDRDARWSAHREALSPETADRFEAAMLRVDDMAARRLARTRDLAELRLAEGAASDARIQAEKGEARLEALQAELTAIREQVAAVAEAAGLDAATSPAAFFPWVDRHGVAVEAHRRLERTCEQHGPMLEKAEALAAALRPLLDLADPTFGACLETARQLARAEREHAEAVKAADERARTLQRDLGERKMTRERRAAEAEASRHAWTGLVERLFGGAVAPATLERSLEPLRNLREHETRRVATGRQVSSMEEDQRQFIDRVGALAGRFGMPADENPLETFDRLRERAEAAQRDAARRADALRRQAEDSAALEEARQRLAGIGRQASELAALFPEEVPTATLADLHEAMATARKAEDLRQRRESLTRQLLDALSAADLDAARLALSGASMPELTARAAILQSDMEDIERRLTAAIETRTSAERDLAAVTGDDGIARLVEKKTTLELEIEETALQYLELTLGLRLADQAIRRYRDAHRSQMMATTETAFTTLTNGAYTQLRSQPDGSSEILLVIDAGGTAKRVEDLSKGTRFQLYLALRAAAYEQLAAQGTSLPFFCDDIFETFDEERTRSACRIMERIGQTGQAIYLTHHRHVVEIAREVCEGSVRIHEIG